MSSALAVINFLIGLQRLLDLVIDEMAKRATKAELEKVRIAIETAKMARTVEAKREASKALKELF